MTSSTSTRQLANDTASSPKRPLPSVLSLGAGVAVLVMAALSLVHPWGDLRAASPGGAALLSGSSAPGEVRALFAQKCGDCHSPNTRWPLYSRIAPSSWLVEHDVHRGREHLNLSRWEQYSIDERIDLLSRIGTQLRQRKMPLKPYLLLHPEARLSDAERKLVIDWTKAERKRIQAASAK
jgi:mono/diheme cytochrome c family protein